jgi:hypothetical protein
MAADLGPFAEPFDALSVFEAFARAFLGAFAATFALFVFEGTNLRFGAADFAFVFFGTGLANADSFSKFS